MMPWFYDNDGNPVIHIYTKEESDAYFNPKTRKQIAEEKKRERKLKKKRKKNVN